MRHFNLCLNRIHVLFLVIGIGHSCAQSPPQTQPKNPNSIEIETVGTIAANGSLEGTVSDRQLYIIGVSYRRLLTQKENVAVRYTFEAIPLAALREPFIVGDCAVANTNPCVGVQAPKDFPLFTHRQTSYGTGASPAGIEFDFLPSKRVQPFFGIRGGFLYFNRDVLEAFASQFNFIIDGRAGVRIPLHAGREISFAYMFQHLSNAGIGNSNPGLDSHMIALSYSFHWPFGRKKH